MSSCYKMIKLTLADPHFLRPCIKFWLTRSSVDDAEGLDNSPLTYHGNCWTWMTWLW